jgi:flavin-dependent dehydrogenase
VSQLPTQTDVFVVGGGPAGLAAAIAARRCGLSVIVADRAQGPVDKACGEGLLPDGVAALRQIGVELGREDGSRFRGIRFVDEGLAAEASFSGNYGIGIRRTRLHRILQERAESAGAVVCWRSRVMGVDPAGVTVDGQTVRCGWVIGADGLHSRVREWAGLQPVWSAARRMGIRQHFRIRPWTDFVEVHWRTGWQAYVTPVGPQEVCIAIIGSEPEGPPNLTALFPALGKRLGRAEATTPLRGAISMSSKLRSVARGRIALIGDASGSVDAVTGDGLSLAFRQADFLGSALAADDLQMYETAHRRVSRMPRLMARLLLLMDRRDGLRQRAISALAAKPYTFERLLAAHVGSLGAAAVSSDAFTFALQVFAPTRLWRSQSH